MSRSYDPMAPLWFSRSTTFRRYWPGGRVKPVSYCTVFRLTSCDGCTASLTVSRSRPTGRCCGSRISPMTSIVARSCVLDWTNGISDPGTAIETGT